MFLQSSPLSSSVVRMEFGREVFHDGLEPLDASRLAQGEKVCCATPAFHTRLEDLTRGRLLGTGLPTAGTAAELDHALVHFGLASFFRTGLGCFFQAACSSALCLTP